MKKERESNIELLRIVAMLLIISFHYVYESGYKFIELNYNSFIVKLFYLVGELGVNIFLLITGYFLVNGKFSGKKLIKLILEVNFYYIISLILINAKNFGGGYGLRTIIKNYILYLPTIFNEYWFFTVYILLYILSPYLNIFIHHIEQEDYKKFLLTIILIWTIIPTIFGLRVNGTEKLLYYNRFIWAIIIYFIGAYMRLYSIKFLEKKPKAKIIAFLSFATMILGIFVIYNFRNFFAKIGTTEVAYFWQPNNILMLLLSISIFKIFIDLKIKNNKIINTLASTTLGIYLIHDGLLTKYIWNNIFHTKKYLNSKISIFYIIGSAILIFLVGAIIDLIRQLIEKYTVKKALNSKLYNKIENKLRNGVKKIEKSI